MDKYPGVFRRSFPLGDRGIPVPQYYNDLLRRFEALAGGIASFTLSEESLRALGRPEDAAAPSADGPYSLVSLMKGTLRELERIGPLAANRYPVVSSPMADVTGAAGDADVVIDLIGVFTDPDGSPLAYSLIGSPASAALAGATLTVSRAAAALETVIVRATDPGGVWAEDGFTVSVTPPLQVEIKKGRCRSEEKKPSPARCAVSAVSGRCILITSPSAATCSRVASVI